MRRRTRKILAIFKSQEGEREKVTTITKTTILKTRTIDREWRIDLTRTKTTVELQ